MSEDAASLRQRILVRRTLMVQYLRLRLDLEDWHGVMDAAADIRELDAQIALLDKLACSPTRSSQGG